MENKLSDYLKHESEWLAHGLSERMESTADRTRLKTFASRLYDIAEYLDRLVNEVNGL